MRTTICIPDDLFVAAERLAQTLKTSRSRLYGDAVREYVARHSAERVTDTLDRVCAAVVTAAELAASAERTPGGDLERAAARRTLGRSDW